MDLHRPFKMDVSPFLSTPLASPALMVLASTAEAPRDASVPCQAPPRSSFGVPASLDKDLRLPPFPSGSYTFTSLYQRQGPLPGAFPSRDFPASLLHLHPHFSAPSLDCSSLGMLNHSGAGAFRPFSPPPHEDRGAGGGAGGVGGAGGGYHSAFTPAKRARGCYTDSPEGQEYEFGSPGGGSLKASAAEDAGRKLFAVSGLLSNGEGPSSPEERRERYSQTPVCPVCGAALRAEDLQEHVEQEMDLLTQLHTRSLPVQRDHVSGSSQSLSLSLSIKCEGESPTSLPRLPDDVHSDRYQTFLRVRANRHTRLNVRIGKLKRRKSEESHDCPDDLGVQEEWGEQRRIQMTSFLGGFKGAVLVSSSGTKDGQDSEADLDVDGDDPLDYGRAQYTDTDVLRCGGEEGGEEGRRGDGITGGTLSDGVTLDYFKWKNEGSPSTSNGENNKPDSSTSNNRTCKNTEIDMVPVDSALTTLDALKSRIRDLEKQLSKADRYKCLICMDAYSTPLTSIQCWHVHCEECWLRSLGAKKLCPQCNTITSPGDLRRVYL